MFKTANKETATMQTADETKQTTAMDGHFPRETRYTVVLTVNGRRPNHSEALPLEQAKQRMSALISDHMKIGYVEAETEANYLRKPREDYKLLKLGAVSVMVMIEGVA